MELKKLLFCQVNITVVYIMKSSPPNTQAYLNNEKKLGFQRNYFKGEYNLWSSNWNLLIDSWIMFDFLEWFTRTDSVITAATGTKNTL